MNSKESKTKTHLFLYICVAAIVGLLFSSCATMRSGGHSLEGFEGPEDIFLGNPMNHVLRTWGEPSKVFVADDSQGRFQKWIYREGNSQYFSDEPYRVVYFENGRVVGWETSN